LHAFIVYFGILVSLLLVSLFFSAAETAFMALNRIRLKYEAEAGDARAASIKKILSNPDQLLGVILLGNTIANVSAASLVTYLIATYVPRNQVDTMSIVGSLLLAVLILILCEITPKIVSANQPERVSRKLLGAVLFCLKIMAPFARLASWIANHLVRLAGLSPHASPFVHALSEDEIQAIIAGSTDLGMGEEKKEMLHNVFQIGETRAREVMIPRVEVTAIEIESNFQEILSVLKQSNFSRIPVYRENLDNIVGILYVKDLLQHIDKPGEVKLQTLLRPVHFVPETARIDEVLRQMQSLHQHMAVVVNEFGSIEGILTLEDLLEEIVGEIRDEHDAETDLVQEISPNLFLAPGSLPVKDFNRAFETKLAESAEYSTLAGFLQTHTGRLLKAGETVRSQNLSFTIDKVDGFRILSVRIGVAPLQKILAETESSEKD
jgi:putative hemolysin